MTLNLEQLRFESANTLFELYKKANAGHIGSSLSSLEILIDLAFVRTTANDRIVLSKGHAAAALYTVLSQCGRLNPDELKTFYKDGTRLAAHPPCNGEIESIPFGTGSLGHGLSLATGLAMSQAFTKRSYKVYCILSEGDLNEGSTWEAALFAAHQKLGQLTVIVDANGLQGIGRSEEIMALEPLVDKWRSFNFEVAEASNGNSFRSLEDAHSQLSSDSRPKCIVARTTKGAGVSYMANKMEWHYLPMNDAEYLTAQEDTKRALIENRHA